MLAPALTGSTACHAFPVPNPLILTGARGAGPSPQPRFRATSPLGRRTNRARAPRMRRVRVTRPET
eukprot:14786909-Alexandrium_andersonii.AAC.1